MCDPVTATVVGIGVASSVAQHRAGVSAASAQNRYNTQLLERTQDESVRNLEAQTRQARTSLQQEQEAARFSANDRARAAARAGATARAAAARGGVTGPSVDALLAGYRSSEARQNYISSRNLSFARRQTVENVRGFQSAARSRINSARRPTARGPSPFGTVLRIGSSVAGGLSDGGYFDR